MKVLICGSRTWPDSLDYIIGDMLNDLDLEYPDGKFTVIEGGAKGADKLAAKWIMDKRACDSEERYEHIQVKANWSKWGPRAGYMRNVKMLTYKPDVVYAFRNFGESKGTDMMVRLAREKNIPTYLVYLDKDNNLCYDEGPAVTQG